MKIKHGLIAAALTLGTVAASATPAMAIGGGGPQLTVVSYLDGSNNIVGQHWFGCPGQPGGTWGETTNHTALSFTPC